MSAKSVAFYSLIFYALLTISEHGIFAESTTTQSPTKNNECTSSVDGGDSSCQENSVNSEASGSVMLNLIKEESSHAVQDALVLTVATNATDGYMRLARSAKVYGFSDQFKVLGLGKSWKGGNMKSVGGGFKLNLLRNELQDYKDRDDKIILFTDGYDIIYLSGLEEIIKKFKSFDARVLFGAEPYCWPDKSLAAKYPPIARGVPYLNSGGFIGYASDIYEILSRTEIKDADDDQLFFSQVYLDQQLREKHKIKLDHKSEIFQNLHGATGNKSVCTGEGVRDETRLIDGYVLSADVQLEFKDGIAYLQNTAYETVPLVVHGNGLSKLALNALGNYVANSWNEIEGCLSCEDNELDLPHDKIESWPSVVMALFVDVATPFFEEFLQKINLLSYPKSRIHLFVYINAPYHEKMIEDFIEKYGKQYADVKQILPRDNILEAKAKHLAMDYCLAKDCGAYFYVDSLSHLDNADTLTLLVKQNRGIVAPLLVRPGQAWSNFWGAIADNGYYARGFDYQKIVDNERRGLWNVPYINNCYLVNATILKNPATRPSYSSDELDFDMAFCQSNRENDVFMYVSNRMEFGHLIDSENFNPKLATPELYEIFNNPHDWEQRYIHENYSAVFQPGAKAIEPCQDVYWFPIVTDRFTRELVELAEAFGKWSDGSNTDPRIEGGYENVPTRDIHMSQLSFDVHWHRFLRDYVKPLQELVFVGYLHDPPHALLNFIVRYKPDEQPSLRPHHDASTYTINIALNDPGIDYEGGGCRFVRYNCSVTDTKRGWMLMHPGRLTHYHEGLPTTKGTRYIMISFVNP